jgi:ribonuclease P protein component
MKKSLTREERLRTQNDFNNVFSKHTKSYKASIPGIALRYCENCLSWNRIGIVVSKKFGNAVKRNRVKRHIREIYRNMKHALRKGFDLVFVVYPGECSYEQRRKQCETLCNKANLYM